MPPSNSSCGYLQGTRTCVQIFSDDGHQARARAVRVVQLVSQRIKRCPRIVAAEKQAVKIL